MREIRKLDLEKFKNTVVWREVHDVLQEREKDMMEELSTESDIDAIRILQGRLAEIKDFINYPDFLLEDSDDRRVQKSQEKAQHKLGESNE